MKSNIFSFSFSHHPDCSRLVKYKTWQLFVFFILLALPVFAQIPRTISYQGFLTNSDGSPKPDGNYTFVFSLYSGSTGGTAFWSESKTLNIKKGLFSTMLGDKTPFGDTVKFGNQYWLGIKIGSDPELSPRVALTAAGYSLSSDNVSNGRVVKSINGIKDNVVLKAGSNAVINTAGNTITISGGNGSGGIQQIKNTDKSLNIINSSGPAATINLKLPLAISDSADDPVSVFSSTAIGSGRGILGQSDGGTGVVGLSNSGNGVYGSGATGVSGNSTNGYGVYAFSENSHALHAGSLNDYGVVGITTNGWGGTYGETSGRAHGILGFHDASKDITAGVYGYGSGSASKLDYAGWFDGTVLNYGNVYIYNDLDVFGTKNFMIDDPLDPLNKYLVHSCIESPERLNVYCGNITTDADGNATVDLPDYFEAVNTNFKYQLTVIGQFAQAIIATEISNNSFTIKTDKPNVKVSWMVSGDRNDPYAKAHPMVVEQEKSTIEKGKYLHPELYGQPEEKGIYYSQTPEMKIPTSIKERQRNEKN